MVILNKEKKAQLKKKEENASQSEYPKQKRIKEKG